METPSCYNCKHFSLCWWRHKFDAAISPGMMADAYISLGCKMIYEGVALMCREYKLRESVPE